MPRRRRDDEVAERAGEILDQQRERRREAAQRGAQTRRERRRQREVEGQPQPAAGNPTQAPTARRSWSRAHADMVTVAIRGHFAAVMRETADHHGMSLSRLLQDALLVYAEQVDAGYNPGTRLARWAPDEAQHGV